MFFAEPKVRFGYKRVRRVLEFFIRVLSVLFWCQIWSKWSHFLYYGKRGCSNFLFECTRFSEYKKGLQLPKPKLNNKLFALKLRCEKFILRKNIILLCKSQRIKPNPPLLFYFSPPKMGGREGTLSLTIFLLPSPTIPPPKPPLATEVGIYCGISRVGGG